ncbi:hypothetical protein VEA_003453 [Vibrio antiquarius]|uniref:Uncharacterized protein n=1 Tax=Vibrio antiquarius (strain Ex25) TaxID=150340 RepID=A0ACA6QMG5_VIBAE|nr:hypothetical protein VEA_003453 [Vibrio antiquarius]
MFFASKGAELAAKEGELSRVHASRKVVMLDVEKLEQAVVCFSTLPQRIVSNESADNKPPAQ